MNTRVPLKYRWWWPNKAMVWYAALVASTLFVYWCFWPVRPAAQQVDEFEEVCAELDGRLAVFADSHYRICVKGKKVLAKEVPLKRKRNR